LVNKESRHAVTLRRISMNCSCAASRGGRRKGRTRAGS
jgi:hypothetical protein